MNLLIIFEGHFDLRESIYIFQTTLQSQKRSQSKEGIHLKSGSSFEKDDESVERTEAVQGRSMR